MALRLSLGKICQTLAGALRKNVTPMATGFQKATHRQFPICKRLHSTRPAWLTEDNVVLSQFPDQHLPEETYWEYLYRDLVKNGNKAALVDGLTGRTLTYSDIIDQVVKCGSALRRMGLTKKDMLAIASPNILDHYILFIAAGACGIPFASLNPLSAAPELAQMLRKVGATAIATIPQLAPVVNRTVDDNEDISMQLKNKLVFGSCEGYRSFSELLEDDGAMFPNSLDIDVKNDPLEILFSSGTTGFPKATVSTHFTLMSDVRLILPTWMETVFQPDGFILNLMPLFHLYGKLLFLVSVGASQTSIVLPRFEPETFVRCMMDYKTDVLPIVPPLAVFLSKTPMLEGKDVSFVRSILCGAAPLSAETTNHLNSIFKNMSLTQGYGMTECGVTHVEPNRPGRAGFVGQIVPNCQGKIVEIGGQRNLGPNEVGEVYLRSPFTMKEYLGEPEATKALIDKDGWIKTGDVGFYDNDGYFKVTDRLKDVINYKGHNLSPVQIEVVILQHPGIIDVAVKAVHCEEAGDIPKAFIVKAPGSDISEEDVHDHVKNHLSALHYLRGGVEFVKEIPKTASGKILRRLLK